MTRFLLSLTLALSLAAAPLGALAADPPKTIASEAGKVAADPNKPIPFRGKITAVDAAGKSFSLKGKTEDRKMALTVATKIVGKDNAPATASALTVGEEVRGQATKAGDTWTAVSVYLGPQAGGHPRSPKRARLRSSQGPAARPRRSPEHTPRKAPARALRASGIPPARPTRRAGVTGRVFPDVCQFFPNAAPRY